MLSFNEAEGKKAGRMIEMQIYPSTLCWPICRHCCNCATAYLFVLNARYGEGALCQGGKGVSASVCPQGRRAVLSVRSGGSIEATQQAWKTAVRQANNDDGVDRLVEDTRHFMYVSRLSLDEQYKMFSEPTHRTMPYKSRFSRCHLILPPMETHPRPVTGNNHELHGYLI